MRMIGLAADHARPAAGFTFRPPRGFTCAVLVKGRTTSRRGADVPSRRLLFR